MEINAVGIMGSNTAGAGAAELFVKNGFQVRLYDDFKDSLSVALAKISWSLKLAGKEELLANIEGVQDLSKFNGADIVIEASAKSADERKLFFAKLRPHLDSRCVVAARCSAAPLSELIEYAELPRDRTLGFHFVEPVRSNLLVEVVRTDHTSDGYLEAGAALLRKIGKTPVIIKDTPGQIVERLSRPFILAALRLLDAGKGYPHEIDAAFREVSGAAMGPFEMADFSGLDSDCEVTEAIHGALGSPERLAPSPTQRRLVQYGQLGRKSTIGFYIYEDGRIVGENPILPNLVKYLGLKKTFKEEIFGDLMRPVVEEARLLASEIMASEYDIETAVKLGLNWPKGPFAYSRDLGHLLEKKKVSEFDKLDTF
ncbi:MAG: 3-hydroxyacyl-CoA dehydrogenase family protein [Elusimicrobiales bacterium]|nr:3-hydroxyacyl-CoA dehydrogenase family protein [Elusimicrobiales bacterium]